MNYSDETITQHTHPAEWALIKKAFPGYRKRSAGLTMTDNVALTGRYWSDGSLSKYVVVDPTGGMKLAPRRNDFPFNSPDTVVNLIDGTQVVQCGIFCGQNGTAYLYRKPEIKEDEPATPFQETA
jgi:hypothetical protein